MLIAPHSVRLAALIRSGSHASQQHSVNRRSAKAGSLCHVAIRQGR